MKKRVRKGKKAFDTAFEGGGDALSPVEAILAKCYSCMAFYADGAVDCKIKTCSLYKWYPYRVVKRIKKCVPVTEEHKNRLRDNLAKARVKRSKK